MNRVLIVDDEKDIRKTIRGILIENGYNVGEAENGKVGIEKVSVFEPSVIILDMEMPVMNGFDFLNITRKDADQNQRFIIAIGDDPEDGDRTFSIEIGADAYLSKPVDESRLIELIKQGFSQIEAHLATDIDPLSNLYTRRFFRNHIHREIARCKRYETLLSAILVSIDDFNDLKATHEEAVINSLITSFATIIRDRTRKTDMSFYWGDDEFLVLSTETGEVGAVRLAEKIRAIVENQSFPSVGKVTASFGVSASVQSETKLLEDAYSALKQAKANDGNMVVVATPTAK